MTQYNSLVLTSSLFLMENTMDTTIPQSSCCEFIFKSSYNLNVTQVQLVQLAKSCYQALAFSCRLRDY